MKLNAKNRPRCSCRARSKRKLESRFLLVRQPLGLLAEKASTPLSFPSASGSLAAPFTPSQIRLAYGLTQVADQGTGQTIAIIDVQVLSTIRNLARRRQII